MTFWLVFGGIMFIWILSRLPKWAAVFRGKSYCYHCGRHMKWNSAQHCYGPVCGKCGQIQPAKAPEPASIPIKMDNSVKLYSLVAVDGTAIEETTLCQDHAIHGVCIDISQAEALNSGRWNSSPKMVQTTGHPCILCGADNATK